MSRISSDVAISPGSRFRISQQEWSVASYLSRQSCKIKTKTVVSSKHGLDESPIGQPREASLGSRISKSLSIMLEIAKALVLER